MKVDQSIIDELSSKYVQDYVLAHLGFYNADLYRDDSSGFIVYRRVCEHHISLDVFDSVSIFEDWFYF